MNKVIHLRTVKCNPSQKDYLHGLSDGVMSAHKSINSFLKKQLSIFNSDLLDTKLAIVNTEFDDDISDFADSMKQDLQIIAILEQVLEDINEMIPLPLLQKLEDYFESGDGLPGKEGIWWDFDNLGIEDYEYKD